MRVAARLEEVIQPWVTAGSDWQDRVTAHLDYLKEGMFYGPFDELAILKKSMHQVAAEIRKEKESTMGELPESTFGPTLHRILKFLQEGNVRRAGILAGRWKARAKDLVSYLESEDTAGATRWTLEELRRMAEAEAMEEAVELA